MKYIITAIIFFSILSDVPLHADTEAVYGNFIVFTLPQNSLQLSAVATESERLLLDTCSSLGRLLPVEKNRLSYALTALEEADEPAGFAQIAGALNVSLYAVINIYSDGKTITAEMRCTAPDRAYAGMEKTITVQSALPSNIPLKLAAEMAALHDGLPLCVKIRPSDGNHVIYAGQWHGLAEGNYTTDLGTLKIVSAGRYSSLGTFSRQTVDAEKVNISIYPHTAEIRKELGARIEKNTLYRYRINSKSINEDNPEARFIIGGCVINPGANVCLPVYGAFLSVGYLGFENAELHKAGFAAGLLSFAVQLTLPQFMTGFDSNFFPWIRDSDKSAELFRLHKFLWCALPLTFTISYIDQLVWQMRRSQNLPPFFHYKDNAAAALSLIFPGAGLIYKGHFIAGWGYYAAEMGLAGFGFYNLHNKRGRSALAGLGALKAVELIHAFTAQADYPFYKAEKQEPKISLMMNTNSYEEEDVFNLGIVMRFDWNEQGSALFARPVRAPHCDILSGGSLSATE